MTAKQIANLTEVFTKFNNINELDRIFDAFCNKYPRLSVHAYQVYLAVKYRYHS